MLKKVVLIGPESTGKSSLGHQLADHYGTLFCPEYAREFLLTHGMNYTYDDLLTIAKGQLSLEDHYTQMVSESEPASRLLFIDTDMYVMKVWCEFVFGKCHRFILDSIIERRYDLYLLCSIDLPWTKDTLREYPDIERRKQLFHMYKDILINQSTPWTEIKGSQDKRLQRAIKAVKSSGII